MRLIDAEAFEKFIKEKYRDCESTDDIKDQFLFDLSYQPTVYDSEVVTQALEKQIPKKMVYKIGKDRLKHEKCPTCGSFHVFGDYCTKCGQKLEL